MRFIGNIIWFVFGGFLISLVHMLLGLFLMITIIGIPFGLQCFKIAGLLLFPFGREVKTNFEKHPIANLLWLIFVGWEMAVFAFIMACLFFITIIGIPFAKQWLKIAMLTLIPFGATF